MREHETPRPHPLLFINDDYLGDFYFRFYDVDGVQHEIAFKARHGRLLIALIDAWNMDEGDHEDFRGCRKRSEYALLVPRIIGDVAPLTESAIDDYVYSIRAKIREFFGHAPQARERAFLMVETVRQRGFRAGEQLRHTRVVVRNTRERIPT